MERKEEKTKSFLESKEYLDLKKEVDESVEQVIQSEEGEDLEPLMRIFDKQISGHYPDAVSREKMFWEIVAENLKNNVFENIHKDIWSAVEGGAYAEIEPIVNKKLSEAIKKLSPTVFHILDKRGFALIVLKDRFYSYLPEISALLKGVTEGQKQKTQIPSGKFVERQDQDWGDDYWTKAMEEKPSKHSKMLKEKTWDVPDLQEIKPGLILEIENIEHDYKQNMEVVSLPFRKNESWTVMVKEKIGFQEYLKRESLADMGILPYENGFWNGWNRPIKWYPREKSEK